MTEERRNHTVPHDCPFLGDHDQIVRMAEKVDAIHSAIYAEKTGFLSLQLRLEQRIGSLELHRAKVIGALIVISIVMPALVTVLVTKLMQ